MMLVDETTTTLVAATPPTVTLDAPVRFAPVIVIAVPPKVDPDVGETEDTVGVGAGTTSLATRKPLPLNEKSGVKWPRNEERKTSATSLQEPPRITRFVPDTGPSGFVDGLTE